MSVTSDISVFEMLGSEFEDDLSTFDFDDVLPPSQPARPSSTSGGHAVDVAVERPGGRDRRDSLTVSTGSGSNEEMVCDDTIAGSSRGVSISSSGTKRSRVQVPGAGSGRSLGSSSDGCGRSYIGGSAVDPEIDDVSDAGSETVGTAASDNRTQRKWIVTLVHTVQVGDRVALTPELIGVSNKVKSWSSQYELAPSGMKHAHVFVHFNVTTRFSWMNTVFKKMFSDLPGFSFTGFSLKFVKGAKMDTIRSWNYCCKTRTRDCGDELVVRINEPVILSKTKKAKKLSQSERMFKLLRKDYGPEFTWDQIYSLVSEEDQILMFTNETKFRRSHATWVADHVRQDGRTIKSVNVLFGASRAGKTVYANTTLFPEDCRGSVFVTTADNFKNWGSYRGEKCILVDEFYGQIKLSEFLSMTDLDKRAPAMNVKYGDVQFNYEHIVFTSNKHPSLWYKNALEEPARYDSFRYRLTNVLYYPITHSDGTPNTYALHETDVEKQQYVMPSVYNRLDIQLMMGLTNVSEYAPGMNYEGARNEL